MIAFIDNYEAVKGMTLFDLKVILEEANKKMDWLKEMAERHPKINAYEDIDDYYDRVRRNIVEEEGQQSYSLKCVKDFYRIQEDQNSSDNVKASIRIKHAGFASRN